MADLQAEAVKETVKKQIMKIISCDLVKGAEAADYLYDNGFRTSEDLKNVKLEDINHLFLLGECRKLMAYWEKAADIEPAREGPRTVSSYNVKWDKLPDRILRQIANKQVLNNDDVNEVVRIVEGDVKASIPNLDRRFFVNVAASMSVKYPDSFKDIVLDGESSRNLSSCEKLTIKLQNRFDNKKRTPKRTMMEIEAPRRPEAYGCIKWQIWDLPEDVTLESLEIKMNEMKTIFSEQDKKDWDWRRKLRPLLTDTYPLQRRDINSQLINAKKRRYEDSDVPALTSKLSTTGIMLNWPFLSTYDGLLHHFQILTGKNFKKCFADWLAASKDDLMDFLARGNMVNERTRAKMRKALAQKSCYDPEATAIIIMLIETLHEKLEFLLKSVPAPASTESIQAALELPVAPLIISEGNWSRSKKFFVSVDGEVRAFSSTFLRAFAMLFCSYYVFNMQYEAKVAKTLDFIQRSVIHINPDTGSKVPKQVRGKRRIPHSVAKLTSEYHVYREATNKENEDVDGDL